MICGALIINAVRQPQGVKFTKSQMEAWANNNHGFDLCHGSRWCVYFGLVLKTSPRRCSHRADDLGLGLERIDCKILLTELVAMFFDDGRFEFKCSLPWLQDLFGFERKKKKSVWLDET
jgi:hypothetical protein